MTRPLNAIIAHIRAVAGDPRISTTLIQTEDLLALCDAASGPEWQPIETAPRDGTAFLGVFQWQGESETEVHECEWCDGRGFFVRPYDEMPDKDSQPVFWMPLPRPPTSSEA
jgi:hypothetical protein